MEPKDDPQFAPPDPHTFMCVYAGPEIMSGTYQPIAVPAPEAEDGDEKESAPEESGETEKE